MDFDRVALISIGIGLIGIMVGFASLYPLGALQGSCGKGTGHPCALSFSPGAGARFIGTVMFIGGLSIGAIGFALAGVFNRFAQRSRKPKVVDDSAPEPLRASPGGWSECVRCGGSLQTREERESGVCANCTVLPS